MTAPVYEVQSDGTIERVEFLPISLDSFADEDDESCDECRGQGFYFIDGERRACICSEDQSPDEDAPEDCPDCEGTGIGNPHVDWSWCPYCHGRGTLRRGDE